MTDVKILEALTNENEMIYNNIKWDSATLEYCKQNRVLDPILLKTKQEYNNKSSEKIKLKDTVKLKSLKQVIKSLDANNVKYLLIKGETYKKYYPKGIYRQSNDYDFILKNIDDFFIVYTILIEEGFELSRNLILSNIKGNIKGVTKFNKIINDINVEFEFNIGGFPISEVTWIESEKLFYDIHTFHLYDISVPIPSDINNLMIFLAESCGRKRFILRDYMDFYFFQKWFKVNKIDVESPKDLYLRLNYRKMIKMVKKKKTNNFLINDTLMSMLHIIPNLITKKELSFSYFFITKICLLCVQKDYFLKTIIKLEKKVSVMKRMESGIPTQLILVNKFSEILIKWIQVKGLNLLVTPIGTFLPIGFGVISDIDYQIIDEIKEGDILNACKTNSKKP